MLLRRHNTHFTHHYQAKITTSVAILLFESPPSSYSTNYNSKLVAELWPPKISNIVLNGGITVRFHRDKIILSISWCCLMTKLNLPTLEDLRRQAVHSKYHENQSAYAYNAAVREITRGRSKLYRAEFLLGVHEDSDLTQEVWMFRFCEGKRVFK